MKFIQVHLFLIWLIAIPTTHCIAASTQKQRDDIIYKEGSRMIGGSIKLDVDEQIVDDIFMRYKVQELDRAYENRSLDTAALHFFNAKQLIEQGPVFEFLRRMPKGGLLHVHNTASVSSAWVIKNITYMPDLLKCANSKNVTIFSFRKNTEKHGCVGEYTVVAEERAKSANKTEYDNNLEKSINLFTPTPEVTYPDTKLVWEAFQNMFATVYDMLNYLPAFKAYHWQMLQELYEDNILYAEVRIGFKETYDANNTYSVMRTLYELWTIVENFKSTHMGFMGIKVIYTISRSKVKKEMMEKIAEFQNLLAADTNFVIGFDLVGFEEDSPSLLHHTPMIQTLPKTANFYFHAGETNRYGTSTDNNLIDAIVLGTKRIGHGYALPKHPLIWDYIKTKGIAVEVCPISNQVLHLVKDLRSHAGAYLMAQNTPMVIAYDDPGFWGANGLSYDFYYAIMSIASNNAGLKALKQLAWNSITYSGMNAKDKQEALGHLQEAWKHFIDYIIRKDKIPPTTPSTLTTPSAPSALSAPSAPTTADGPATSVAPATGV